MKNSLGEVIYVGKAGNLKRRVASYFQKAHDYRIQRMVNEIRRIDYRKTDTAIEALILESELIKKYQPVYNVREKDDTSFLYVEFTKEKFPRVLLIRGKSLASGRRFGPFTAATSIREALRILRKIFPYSVHPITQLPKKPCFDYQIGLCPGTCVEAISREDYLKNIKNLKLFFEGKKKKILKNLEKEMKLASKKLEFEKAAELRGRIFALKHIQDIAVIARDDNFQFLPLRGISRRETISPPKADPPRADNFQKRRIEGYDISNISGTSATGSMVVFKGESPDKDQYRKFRIQNFKEPNDVGMLKEVLKRRLNHREWSLPDLILVDGGLGQVNAARSVLAEAGFKIPVIGIAKGPTRKKNEFVGAIPKGFSAATLIRVRDEAHRFAIAYHRQLRGQIR